MFVLITLVIMWVGAFIFLKKMMPEMECINKAKKKYGRKEFRACGKFKLITEVNPKRCEPCDVICLKSRLVVETDEYEISIANEKLIRVYVLTNPEEKEYYDDVVGAIAGAEAGGAIGAIIGGTGVRKVKDREDYLIIKYIRDGKERGMTIDATRNVQSAYEIVRKYGWLKKKNKEENKRKAKEAKNKQKIRIDM